MSESLTGIDVGDLVLGFPSEMMLKREIAPCCDGLMMLEFAAVAKWRHQYSRPFPSMIPCKTMRVAVGSVGSVPAVRHPVPQTIFAPGSGQSPSSFAVCAWPSPSTSSSCHVAPVFAAIRCEMPSGACFVHVLGAGVGNSKLGAACGQTLHPNLPSPERSVKFCSSKFMNL